ncbi:hypothetical protein L1987_00701 [Smallanthus sonchifolius]|uniref:Uncharacterized protein n=1 Tax=Smallanthus sonchifolius TaxID=185202 RepID=A0ACB9K2W2_9ASTR|nr:hypothetical protein L1987_00701 [Smallanthus sonchifolius]
MAAQEQQEEINTWSSNSWTYVSSLRQQSPLIQCITNLVSMDLMANTLLAAGASPAMIHSILEIPDFTPHTQAVLINVGTLTPEWLPAMKAAAGVANQLGKPWDPPSDAVEAAKSLAKPSGAIVGISGSVDFVTDGQRVVGAHNGLTMMQKITASGCAVTALIAAFVAIDPTRPFEATASAFSVFGLAGEIGMGLAKGPASLRMHLVDSLHGLDQETVLERVKITSFS